MAAANDLDYSKYDSVEQYGIKKPDYVGSGLIAKVWQPLKRLLKERFGASSTPVDASEVERALATHCILYEFPMKNVLKYDSYESLVKFLNGTDLELTFELDDSRVVHARKWGALEFPMISLTVWEKHPERRFTYESYHARTLQALMKKLQAENWEKLMTDMLNSVETCVCSSDDNPYKQLQAVTAKISDESRRRRQSIGRDSSAQMFQRGPRSSSRFRDDDSNVSSEPAGRHGWRRRQSIGRDPSEQVPQRGPRSPSQSRNDNSNVSSEPAGRPGWRVRRNSRSRNDNSNVSSEPAEQPRQFAMRRQHYLNNSQQQPEPKERTATQIVSDLKGILDLDLGQLDTAIGSLFSSVGVEEVPVVDPEYFLENSKKLLNSGITDGVKISTIKTYISKWASSKRPPSKQ